MEHISFFTFRISTRKYPLMMYEWKTTPSSATFILSIPKIPEPYWALHQTLSLAKINAFMAKGLICHNLHNSESYSINMNPLAYPFQIGI